MTSPQFLSFLYALLKFFLGFGFISLLVSGQCLEHQRTLLLQFKQELSIDPQADSKLMDWIPTQNCCLWDGVRCDPQSGYVIGLDLTNSSITGGFNSSSSLFNLHHLRYLNLAYNNFNFSPFPSGFSKLSSLTHLNLSWSNFGGPIPLEISSLRMLVSLDLSTYSYILSYPAIPRNLDLEKLVKNLTKLRVLHLDGIDIKASNSSRWCQVLSSSLPNLRVLSLSTCNLYGAFHHSLLQLQFLNYLNLNRNNLESKVPDFLATLSSLTSLHLSGCGLYGRFPDGLFLMPKMRTLDLSFNYNLMGNLPEFPQGSVLEDINLSETMFTGNLPNSIKNLARLKSLQLHSCSFYGSIPSSIENLTQLTYLDFSANNFSGSIPSLALSKRITGLIFSHNHFSGTIPLCYGNELDELEILYLRNNSLTGMIPLALFAKPSIKWLRLDHNNLHGRLSEFQNASSSLLKEIDLSQNELQGPIPMAIFNISGLNILILSFNHFHGTIKLDMIRNINQISTLDLSDNFFSFEDSGGNSTSLSYFGTLRLGSCNIKRFPDFFRNSSYLGDLDLSNNKIRGEIPNWIWKFENLVQLNLSGNMLSSFENPELNLSSSMLAMLDLHSNLLEGDFLLPPPSIIYLDYSSNRFSSTLPFNIFNDLIYIPIFISLSRNKFWGEIPVSLCSNTCLEVLDLSNNHFNGSIPPCLGSNRWLRVLKLRNNRLDGPLPQAFGKYCKLRTMDASRNYLEGPLPRSLPNCRDLEVLDVGNNKLNGSFPLWLESLPNLRVLILRSNNLGGSISYSHNENAFSTLQIIDLSSNNFIGSLPSKWFRSWKWMMKGDKELQASQVLRFTYLQLSERYYQDSVTLMNKGLNMELEKILTIFISIDLSNNQLEGEIPETIGELQALYVLNLSSNRFNGHIPYSFKQLKQLGSLDLSNNKLSGKIPQQLTTLTFLSFLNLSGNLLEGEIPRGNQFDTFTADSFKRNAGLCGFQLSKTCHNALPRSHSNASPSVPTKRKWGIDWDLYWIGFGCGGGIGINIGFIIGNVTFNNISKRRGRRNHKNRGGRRRVHNHPRK